MPLRLYIFIVILACPGIVHAQYSRKDVDKYALEADSLNLLARTYMLKNKRDNAKLLLEKAIELSQRSGNTTILARCYIDYAAVYILQGNYTGAKKYIDIAWPYLHATDHRE